MDLSGGNVCSVIRSGTLEQKISLLQELKTHVKKYNVDLAWVDQYFEALSIASDSADESIKSLAFGVVCHLVKRVSIQDQKGAILRAQGFLVLPLIIPRMADVKEQVKRSARRALEAYWLRSPKTVEAELIEMGLGNRNSLVVNETVVWLNNILTRVNPQFQLDSFLDPLARVLHDHADHKILTSNICVLFQNYYDIKDNRIGKFDLQKALERNGVSLALRTSIMGTNAILQASKVASASSSEYPYVAVPPRPKPAAMMNIPVLEKRLSSTNLHSKIATIELEPERKPELKLEPKHKSEPVQMGSEGFEMVEAVEEPFGVSHVSELQSLTEKLPNYSYDNTIKPINVADANEIYSLFSGMTAFFDNKETESNWSAREKSIVKIRSLVRGNAAFTYFNDLAASIRDLHEGICKGLLSLRTTLTVNSCQLVKEMAFIFRERFEPLTDLFMPTLIRLCSSTKHLTNMNAHVAICAVLVQCPLTNKLTQKVLSGAFEKSVNTKTFASCWLQIYMVRTRDSWKSQASDIVEKSLVKLLPDPNVSVRSAAKDAYWRYHEYAQSAALALRSVLDTNVNRALDRSRPKGVDVSVPVSSAGSRPSLKESIMAKKRDLKFRQSESRSSSRCEVIKPNLPSHKPKISSGTTSTVFSNRESAVSRDKEVTASSDKVTASSDKVTASSDKVTASSDKVTASSDKVTASSDKVTASIDKVTASTVTRCTVSSEPLSRHSSLEGIQKSQQQDFPKLEYTPLDTTKIVPQYFSSTLSHPSVQEEARPQARPRPSSVAEYNTTFIGLCVSKPTKTSETPETPKYGKLSKSTVPDIKKSQSPEKGLHDLLTSKDDRLLLEGMEHLKAIILSGEKTPAHLESALKRLSSANPMSLKPLFEINTFLLRHVITLFAPDDFFRMVCILIPPTQDTFNAILHLFTPDEFYSSANTMLSCVLELTDIFDDGLLIMQFIKFKDKILTMVLQMLAHATSILPITDVNMSKLLGNLFEFVPVLYQTSLSDNLKVLLRKLYAIHSSMFVSSLSQTSPASKQEIELIVGIDDSLVFKKTETNSFSISPLKVLDHRSPLKIEVSSKPVGAEQSDIKDPDAEVLHVFPENIAENMADVLPDNIADVLPDNIADVLPDNIADRFRDVTADVLTESIAEVLPNDNICLDQPPHMNVVEEDDIVMDDSEDTRVNMEMTLQHEEKVDDVETGVEEFKPATFGSSENNVKRESLDINMTQKPDLSIPQTATKDLENGFTSVNLSYENISSIERFLEKTDPLSKFSSRSRPIAIFDDSEVGSPQKVRDYDFTEFNWFNFLMAKMSLTYGLDELERYSKNDFRELCKQLSSGSVDETGVARMLKYLKRPDPETLIRFLQEEGYLLAENAAMEYLSLERSNLVGGLMILKQLLVNRFPVEIQRFWAMLVDLSGLKTNEPLRTLELAISETFDEVLCGIYSSKELLDLVVGELRKDLKGAALEFALDCLHKLISMDSLVLSINEELVASVDGVMRDYISHSRSEVRKLVIEVYACIYRAAKISDSSERSSSQRSSSPRSSSQRSPSPKSSLMAISQVMSAMTVPQQRIIEHFSRL